MSLLLMTGGPYTGSQTTYKRSQHWGKKEHSIFQQSSTANISRVGVRLGEPLPYPRWNVYWLDIINILCRWPQLLDFISKMAQSCHVQKTLFLKQSSPASSSYSLCTSSMIVPESTEANIDVLFKAEPSTVTQSL